MDLLKLPLISFVVTSYNYGDYIAKTLKSIENQTYENIEIIVVDDFSNDNSIKIINDFIKNSKLDIRFIRHESNKGQMQALLTGLSHSNGQFVCFIDSDDILINDYAKTLLRVHMSTSVAFASSQVIEIGENDEIHTTYSVSSFQKGSQYELKTLEKLLDVNVEDAEFKVLNLKNAPLGGWWWSALGSAMFRKSAIEILLNFKNTGNWRICPDKFIFNFAHLIGSSAIVYAPLLANRRHDKNAGVSQKICGMKRYNDDKTTSINMRNNKRIRKDLKVFINDNREIFDQKFGRNNVRKMILQINLSYFYIFSQIKNFLLK